MKHTSRKLLAILAALLMLALCACAPPSPAEMMQKGAENMAAAESMQFSMDMELSMNVMGQNADIRMEAEGSQTKSPMAAYMSISGAAMNEQTQMQMYRFEEGENLTIYASEDGETWSRSTAGKGDSQAAQYDVEQSAELYLKSASSFKLDGEEELRGRKTWRLIGVIEGQDLVDVMTSSSVSGMTGGMMDEQNQAMLEALKNSGGLEVTYWLEKDTCLPARIQMDMTSLMDEMMNQMIGQMGGDELGVSLGIDACKIDMEMWDYGKVPPIELPDAAKEAAL